MGTGSKIVAHEGMGSGTGIFYKCGYGNGHYSTLPIGGPLPSLVSMQGFIAFRINIDLFLFFD